MPCSSAHVPKTHNINQVLVQKHKLIHVYEGDVSEQISSS